VKHEKALYAVPREQLAGPRTPWRKIFGDDAGVTDAFAFRDTLYLLSHDTAPRRKVLRLELTKRGPNDLSRAELLLPESDAVVRYLTVAKDALYVQLLDAGLARIQRIVHGTNKASEVTLPVAGTVRDLVATNSVPGVTFQLTSWTLAPCLFRFDPATNKVLDTGVVPASPVDFSQVAAREVRMTTPDGTSVPLSIIARGDLAADKTHPTLLHAYGAYGNVAEPSFDPKRLAWIERGGVFAVCHPRGGGEFGEAWHDAGKLGTKQNTIDDVLACADYLVKERLTSPAQLGLRGVSAGGIPASNGLTRQPAHFGAVVIRVGMVNALRFEQIPIGPFNTSEFGTVQTEEGFRMLLAIDANQQVRDQTAYPAVLLATGNVDPRVSPWQACKLAARLQAATSSGKPVLLRVDYGAGHGHGTTKTKEADEIADEYTFLFWQLAAAAGPT
jgi:prolyl oligopeptidase